MYRITQELIGKCEQKNPDFILDFNSVKVVKNNQYVHATCRSGEHVKSVGISTLLNHVIKCDDCLTEMYRKSAESFGWNYIERLHSDRSSILQCRNCFDFSKKQNSSIIRNEMACYGCMFDKYFEFSKDTNFHLVDVIRKGDKNLAILSCKEDGNVIEVATKELSKHQHTCAVCRENKIKSKLLEKGCYFESASGSVVKYRDLDGLLRSASSKNILKDGFAISTSMSKWFQPTDVYLFSTCLVDHGYLPNGVYFKIGISKNPERRRNNLKLIAKSSVEILFSCYNRFEAQQQEKFLHKALMGFKLDHDKAKLLANKAGRKGNNSDGYTEWFYLKEGEEMPRIAALCIISMSELEKENSINLENLNKSESYLNTILFNLGMDVSLPYDCQDVQHRNKFNEVVTCKRFCGNERGDTDWLNSGYASVEALDRAKNNKLLTDLYAHKQMVE